MLRLSSSVFSRSSSASVPTSFAYRATVSARGSNVNGREPAFARRRTTRPAVFESVTPYANVRIAEADEVVEGIVDRMVRAARRLPAEAEVEGRDAEMLKEGRVVRPGAQGLEPQVRGAPSPLFWIPGDPRTSRRARCRSAMLTLRFGVDDVPRDLVHEPLERVRAARAEEPAAVAVRVQIGDRLFRKLVRVRLDPLRRADETRLLAVPRRVHDRALRPPAGLRERAERLRLGQLGHEAADRVLRAVHPRVVVVAAQNPLVRKLRALQHREDVAHRAPSASRTRPSGAPSRGRARGGT